MQVWPSPGFAHFEVGTPRDRPGQRADRKSTVAE